MAKRPPLAAKIEKRLRKQKQAHMESVLNNNDSHRHYGTFRVLLDMDGWLVCSWWEPLDHANTVTTVVDSVVVDAVLLYFGPNVQFVPSSTHFSTP